MDGLPQLPLPAKNNVCQGLMDFPFAAYTVGPVRSRIVCGHKATTLRLLQPVKASAIFILVCGALKADLQKASKNLIRNGQQPSSRQYTNQLCGLPAQERYSCYNDDL